MLLKFRGSGAFARQCQEDMMRAVGHCDRNTYFGTDEMRGFGSTVLNTWIISEHGRITAVGTLERVTAPYNPPLYKGRWARVEEYKREDGFTRNRVVDISSGLAENFNAVRRWVTRNTPPHKD